MAVLVTAFKRLTGDPDSSIFSWDSYGLHKRWRHMLVAFKLEGYGANPKDHERLRISPASLRPGGATRDYMRFQSVTRLMWRGRWKTLRVLEHYLQLGVYHLMSFSFSSETIELIKEYRQRMLQLIEVLK